MPKTHLKPKPLLWVGSSKKDLQSMPEDVQDTFGYALHLAQAGSKHTQAKPLKGFGSAGVLEAVESEAGSTYRAVYTVKIAGAVYVLHCFQKKIHLGQRHPQARHGPDPRPAQGRLGACRVITKFEGVNHEHDPH